MSEILTNQQIDAAFKIQENWAARRITDESQPSAERLRCLDVLKSFQEIRVLLKIPRSQDETAN